MNGKPTGSGRDERVAAKDRDEFDSVTADAIKAKAPIPPTEWPEDQRRAFLGGVFGYRNGEHLSPYTDPDCRDAWHKGWERERKDARGY